MPQILLVIGMLLVAVGAFKVKAIIDTSTLEQKRKNRLHSVVICLIVAFMGIFSFILFLL